MYIDSNGLQPWVRRRAKTRNIFVVIVVVVFVVVFVAVIVVFVEVVVAVVVFSVVLDINVVVPDLTSNWSEAASSFYPARLISLGAEQFGRKMALPTVAIE